jgi:hypothetical protein
MTYMYPFYIYAFCMAAEGACARWGGSAISYAACGTEYVCAHHGSAPHAVTCALLYRHVLGLILGFRTIGPCYGVAACCLGWLAVTWVVDGPSARSAC